MIRNAIGNWVLTCGIISWALGLYCAFTAHSLAFQLLALGMILLGLWYAGSKDDD